MRKIAAALCAVLLCAALSSCGETADYDFMGVESFTAAAAAPEPYSSSEDQKSSVYIYAFDTKEECDDCTAAYLDYLQGEGLGYYGEYEGPVSHTDMSQVEWIWYLLADSADTREIQLNRQESENTTREDYRVVVTITDKS